MQKEAILLLNSKMFYNFERCAEVMQTLKNQFGNGDSIASEDLTSNAPLHRFITTTCPPPTETGLASSLRPLGSPDQTCSRSLLRPSPAMAGALHRRRSVTQHPNTSANDAPMSTGHLSKRTVGHVLHELLQDPQYASQVDDAPLAASQTPGIDRIPAFPRLGGRCVADNEDTQMVCSQAAMDPGDDVHALNVSTVSAGEQLRSSFPRRVGDRSLQECADTEPPLNNTENMLPEQPCESTDNGLEIRATSEAFARTSKQAVALENTTDPAATDTRAPGLDLDDTPADAHAAPGCKPRTDAQSAERDLRMDDCTGDAADDAHLTRLATINYDNFAAVCSESEPALACEQSGAGDGCLQPSCNRSVTPRMKRHRSRMDDNGDGDASDQLAEDCDRQVPGAYSVSLNMNTPICAEQPANTLEDMAPDEVWPLQNECNEQSHIEAITQPSLDRQAHLSAGDDVYNQTGLEQDGDFQADDGDERSSPNKVRRIMTGQLSREGIRTPAFRVGVSPVVRSHEIGVKRLSFPSPGVRQLSPSQSLSVDAGSGDDDARTHEGLRAVLKKFS